MPACLCFHPFPHGCLHYLHAPANHHRGSLAKIPDDLWQKAVARLVSADVADDLEPVRCNIRHTLVPYYLKPVRCTPRPQSWSVAHLATP